MQRKRIQPKRTALRSKASLRKRPSKTSASFAETVVNWLIAALIVIILAFAASVIWRFVEAKKAVVFTQQPDAEGIKPETKVIRIEVLNGCGVTGVAAKFRDYLRAQGFDVVNTDNYRSYDIDSSFVIDRVSIKSKYGLKLADALGIPRKNVQPILSDELAVESSLVLGKDYASLKGFSEAGQ